MSRARDMARPAASAIGLSRRERSAEVMRWGLCFAVVAAIQGALAAGYLIHDEPSAANEAPEAAIMIDLPPELALPPAESVESVASSAAEEVEAPDAETVPEDAAEALPDMETTQAIEPDTAEAVEDEAPVEPETETLTAEAPDEVVEALPPDEVVASEVAVPTPPKARPKPQPVRKEIAKPKPEAKPVEKPKPQPQKREASRAAMDGQRASGAGAPDPNAFARYRSTVAAAIRRRLHSVSTEGNGRTATVSFTVGASGALAGVSISKSSGVPALDAAALSMVRSASPVPPIPPGLPRSYPGRIPIRFD